MTTSIRNLLKLAADKRSSSAPQRHTYLTSHGARLSLSVQSLVSPDYTTAKIGNIKP